MEMEAATLRLAVPLYLYTDVEVRSLNLDRQCVPKYLLVMKKSLPMPAMSELSRQLFEMTPKGPPAELCEVRAHIYRHKTILYCTIFFSKK